MICFGDVFCTSNVQEALCHLMRKADTIASDGMRIGDLESYWELNGSSLVSSIIDGKYYPSVVKNYEITNSHGKRRTVSNQGAVDRLICRMLSQVFQKRMDSLFSDRCFAYRPGKGVQKAVEMARTYVGAGKSIVVSIDIKDFFDSISIEVMMSKLKRLISDERLLVLIERYMRCRILNDEEIVEKTSGILQGNPLSPIFSNVYMREFDLFLDGKGYDWIRFADNIYMFFDEYEAAMEAYGIVCGELRFPAYGLTVNMGKSGVYDDIESLRILGYSFFLKSGNVDVRKASYVRKKYYSNWHPCVIQRVKNEYHIVQNGVLNRKDFSLLFENDEEKHHIPVEVTDQINVYGDVCLTSGITKTLYRNSIRMSFTDKYGNLIGHFVPSEYSQSGKTTIEQCKLYIDPVLRVETAKRFEIAGIHNMRANLRYYKKSNKRLNSSIEEMTEAIKSVNESKSIQEMMLIEARAKQIYYNCFNEILKSEDFMFVQRTKRPPKDEINALISFGNVVLYNQILQMIWKTSLDPRIGVVHSTNKRSASLNLDFADVFKPVVTDRLVFSLINKHQLLPKRDFSRKGAGVFLSDTGKRIYLEAFENKMDQKIVYKEMSVSYRRLLEKEIQSFTRALLSGSKYKPFKYY